MKNELALETSLVTGRQLKEKNAAHHRLITLVLEHHLQHREFMTMYCWGLRVIRRRENLEACIGRLQRLQTLQTLKQKKEPWKLRRGPRAEVSILWIWAIITSHLIIPYYMFGWKGPAVLCTSEVGYILVVRLLRMAKYVR